MDMEPAPIRPGDRISARWLNKLLNWVRSLQITVARDCGLTLTPGLFGMILGYNPTPTFWIGLTTSTLMPRSGTTISYGTVQPYTLVGAVLTPVGPVVSVGNWTGSTIATGVYIQYLQMYKQFLFNGNDCSGAATS